MKRIINQININLLSILNFHSFNSFIDYFCPIMSHPISILIPVFNYDALPLVSALIKQLKTLNIEIEIVVIDDCSTKKELRLTPSTLKEFKELNYIQLSENIGRSSIRNLLAIHAKFEYLLFIDVDSLPLMDDYLKRYAICYDNIVYGGTNYHLDQYFKNSLHWKYGKTYEAKPLTDRENNPILSFRSNNFMIKKSIFLENRFDESITEYGHEDTLFAIQLSTKGFNISHIDNPVIHTGIETNQVFLTKTKTSIDNLIYLRRTNHSFETSLTKTGDKLSIFKNFPFFDTILHTMENLASQGKLMMFFQVWKLLYYIKMR